MLHCVLWEKFLACEGPTALDRATSGAAEARAPPEQIVRDVLARHAAEICGYAASWSKSEPAEEQTLGKAIPLQRHSLDVCCSPLGANGPLPERQKALIRVGLTKLANFVVDPTPSISGHHRWLTARLRGY